MCAKPRLDWEVREVNRGQRSAGRRRLGSGPESIGVVGWPERAILLNSLCNDGMSLLSFAPAGVPSMGENAIKRPRGPAGIVALFCAALALQTAMVASGSAEQQAPTEPGTASPSGQVERIAIVLAREQRD